MDNIREIRVLSALRTAIMNLWQRLQTRLSVRKQKGAPQALSAAGDSQCPLPLTGEEYSLTVLGMLYYDRGYLTEAEHYLHRAAAERPQLLAARYVMATIAAERGEFNTAVEIMLESQVDSINSRNVYQILGGALAADGLCEAAIGIYCLGINRGYADFALYADLANLYLSTCRRSEALVFAAKALKLAPDQESRFSCYAVMADCAFGLEDYKSAAEYARQGFNCNPGDFRNAFVYGNSLVQLNRLEEAQQVFRRITIAHPNRHEGFRSLGVVLGMVEQYEEALRMLWQALWLEPDDTAAQGYLVEFYDALVETDDNEADTSEVT
jgi:tetratricopeptide (TPR) repeat protein